MFVEGLAMIARHNDERRLLEVSVEALEQCPESGICAEDPCGVASGDAGAFGGIPEQIRAHEADPREVERIAAALLVRAPVGGVGVVEVDPEEEGPALLDLEPCQRRLDGVLARPQRAARAVVDLEPLEPRDAWLEELRRHERRRRVALLLQAQSQ
jgi:hypothetical protein